MPHDLEFNRFTFWDLMVYFSFHLLNIVTLIRFITKMHNSLGKWGLRSNSTEVALLWKLIINEMVKQTIRLTLFLYEARLFMRNLIKPPTKTFLVECCYQRRLVKKLIKLLFAVQYLLLLSSFTFQTLQIRVITFQIDAK